ncbi:hypothetical protein LJC17_04215 [Acholeplasma sp. OttesenSCG-928-E16]|nr:hypothetical protein [Acholeplasma sp. OttesenSCG-928-E16]
MKKLLSLFMVALVAVSLFACTNNDEALLQEAADALLIETLVEDKDAVVSGFDLPTSLRNKATASWTTSDATYAEIKDRGNEGYVSVIVDRPTSADLTVTLTGALKLGRATDTKVFTITISKLPDGTVEYTTISDLVAAGKAAWEGKTQTESKLVPSFKLTNVTVVNKDEDAFYVADSAGHILMVYQTPTVEVGDKGTLIGQLDSYYWALQATGATLVLKDENQSVTPANVNLNTYDFASYASTDAKVKDSKTDPAYIKYMKFDAYVVERKDFTGGGNYQLTFVDPTNGADFDKGFVLSYYKGLLHEESYDYVGKEVSVTATVRELRDSRQTTSGKSQPVWSLSIASITEKGNMPDATLAAVDAKSITIQTDFPSELTYTLPAAGSEYNSVLAWSVVSGGDYAAISGTTLTLSPVAAQRNEAVIKVVATLNGQTDEREFKIYVGDYVDKTIAEVLGASVANGDVIRVEGIISLVISSSYGNALLTDGAGKHVYIYGNFGSSVPSASNLKVGNKVKIVGEKSVYSGLVQVKATQLTVVETNQTVPAAANIDSAAKMVANISGLITATGTVSNLKNNDSTSSNTSFTLTLANGDTIAVRASSKTLNFDGLANGASVTISGFGGYFESGYTSDSQGSTPAKTQFTLYEAAGLKVNPAA